jgi:hypothetical protein
MRVWPVVWVADDRDADYDALYVCAACGWTWTCRWDRVP